MKPIYLDHSATTPVHPEVLTAMISFFANHFGNPSSIHREGRLAREAVEGARARVAALIGAAPAEIVFTSGGTEADNLALLGTAFAEKQGRNHIITSTIEHHAVENACRHLAECGFEVTFLPVDGEGRVNPDDVRKVITEKTFLISIMHANNEIGMIQPLRGIAVSAGSACTAGSTKISHVLAALGMPEALAVGTVRFSLGRDNTEEEIRRAVSILKALVEKRRILAELEGSVGGRGCR